MIAQIKLSLEQFLTLPEGDITYELIEGKVQPKIYPKRFHSRLTGTLYLLLTNWSQSKGEVGIEWGVTLQKNGKNWVP
ncbi:MAG: Uma2 family endonuclease, partial [Crocosphaera sp.]